MTNAGHALGGAAPVLGQGRLQSQPGDLRVHLPALCPASSQLSGYSTPPASPQEPLPSALLPQHPPPAVPPSPPGTRSPSLPADRRRGLDRVHLRQGELRAQKALK